MESVTVHDRYQPAEIERFYRDGFWSPISFSGLLDEQAASRPDKIFCLDDDTALTYAQLREASLRLADHADLSR